MQVVEIVDDRIVATRAAALQKFSVRSRPAGLPCKPVLIPGGFLDFYPAWGMKSGLPMPASCD